MKLVFAFSWFLVALFFAYHRSFWGDEFNRLQDLKLGLIPSLQKLFTEPSPFTPGEVILNFIFQIFFSEIFSEEIWARLQGIGWGVATVWLAFTCRLCALPLFVFFSVPLMMLSVEMRPYGSLFFSGALAFKIIWDSEIKFSKPTQSLALFSIFFGHLYGVCFVSLALLFCRHWFKAFLGFVFVAIILLRFPVASQGSNVYVFSEIFKQTLGALGNPHKATYILFPAFLLGGFFLFKENKTRFLKLGLLLFAAVFIPVLVAVKSGYFFVPRQVIGGSFLYLALCSFGFQKLAEQEKFKLKPFVYALCFVVSVVPWVLCMVLKIPPFPNQPMHRFQKVAHEIVDGGYKSALFLDACNQTNFEYYVSQIFQKAPTIREEVKIGAARTSVLGKAPPLAKGLGGAPDDGVRAVKACWDEGFCVHLLLDTSLCSIGSDTFLQNPQLSALLKFESFDVIVHSFHLFPAFQKPAFRTW